MRCGSKTGTTRATSRWSTEADGYYSLLVADAGAGTRYRYVLDGDALADPASRYQPEGPFGPSEVIDPERFHWEHSLARGVELAGQVIYELHPGTFTPEGTWRSAIAKLPLLADSGITTIELMPVSRVPWSVRLGLRRCVSVRADTSVRDA